MEKLGTSDWHATCIDIGVPAEARNCETGEIANDQPSYNVLCEAQDLASREEGQDLVGNALVLAMIAFGATAGVGELASGINTVIGGVSSKLVSAM
jgi:hypothetical protein